MASVGPLANVDCAAPPHGVAARRPHGVLAARLADYVELTKPKIAVLELAVVAAAAMLAGLDAAVLPHVLLGTLLVAASASALNQWIEQETDGRMDRTMDRPLPAGRLGRGEVLVFGILLVVIGSLYLGLFASPITAGFGLITWLLYVLVYTPLKSRHSLNTLLGAVAGAMPVLIGWSAMGAAVDLRAAALFSILLLWQFPHFMAIAWIYRHQYAVAGLKMVTVTDPRGRWASVQAVLAAAGLLPVSLFAMRHSTGDSAWFAAGLFLMGIGQLAIAVMFSLRRDEWAARWLLRASLIYLPVVLVLLVLEALL